MRRRKGMTARAWAKVDRRGPDECWPWTGSQSGNGYGRLSIDNGASTVPAHRVIFAAENGFLPPVVMHTCDNGLCCNPAHLVAGSPRDNTRDMLQKRRGRWRTKTPKVIAALYLAENGFGVQEAAKACGVHYSTVYRAKRK